jgi:superfamily I DNA and/or RNA helicase/very-short-patch-repair endonuclease
MEMASVLRELAKQRAHLPVRQLVHRIPNLLPKLKPCLLMSPLSVAQYLDATHSNFDAVVFDEASQIPVWDAVGAIARGKQLVLVGDPKQLPPTNFFNRADDADDSGMDNAEDAPVQDLESILDECLGAGLPTLRLEWHYRSRHGSLITFSNHRYYDSRLITFPSPVTNDLAVKLKVLPGVYDRGASRTNRIEADAIVKEIVEHFSDDAKRKLTMGVVTFNQTQQRLIETLLDEELRKSPELERRIAEHGPERLFVKNLENVQGDERDFILFSITYGKDAAGKMPMIFGPLNQDGGQRRLNVAITRARVGVTIFSSIRPEEIDLSRTRSAGVTDLKNYLEFAIKGPRAIVEQSLPTGLEPDSPLEIEVIRALRDKGRVVHPQVGCSGYRIDMAIVHPTEPGKYLLGVECDGATYHSMPTARDRDRLRQFVLEGLGWTLHRIWSTDWWTDSESEIQKLEATLNALLN